MAGIGRRDYRASDEYIEAEAAAKLMEAALKALGLGPKSGSSIAEVSRWEHLLEEFTPETQGVIRRVADLLGPAGKEALQVLIEGVRDDTIERQPYYD